MNDLTPHPPQNRNLLWSDSVFDLQDALIDKIDEELYIVGGAVRDAYSHRPIKDLDFATPRNSIKIAKTIANVMNGDVYVMDDERNVARALIDTAEGRLAIDVAQFRGDSLLADLQGRDFTINAMAVDFMGDLNLLIDPLNGETDGLTKVIRRCTPQSIADDPIRGLRAIRQSVQLGFKIEPQTREDIRAQSSKLMDTSPERVRDEFFSILSTSDVRKALRVADVLGYLSPIVPEVELLRDKKLPSPHIFDAYTHSIEAVDAMSAIINIISYRRTDNTAASFRLGVLAMQMDRFRAKLNDHIGQIWADNRSHQSLLLLGALLHKVASLTDKDSETIAKKRADEMRLSSQEKKRLSQMLVHFEDAMQVDVNSQLALHRYWFSLRESGVDACLMGLAHYLATHGNEIEQDEWLMQIERAVLLLQGYFLFYDTVVEPSSLINGTELIEELSLSPSPMVGELITHIREGQVTGDVTTRDEALSYAREYLKSN